MRVYQTTTITINWYGKQQIIVAIAVFISSRSWCNANANAGGDGGNVSSGGDSGGDASSGGGDDGGGGGDVSSGSDGGGGTNIINLSCS